MNIKKGVSQELADFKKQNISQIEYQLSFDIPENQKKDILGKTTSFFNSRLLIRI